MSIFLATILAISATPSGTAQETAPSAVQSAAASTGNLPHRPLCVADASCRMRPMPRCGIGPRPPIRRPTPQPESSWASIARFSKTPAWPARSVRRCDSPFAPGSISFARRSASGSRRIRRPPSRTRREVGRGGQQSTSQARSSPGLECLRAARRVRRRGGRPKRQRRQRSAIGRPDSERHLSQVLGRQRRRLLDLLLAAAACDRRPRHRRCPW